MSRDNPLQGELHVPQISWAKLRLLAVEGPDGELHPIPEGTVMRGSDGGMTLASAEESRAYVARERSRMGAPPATHAEPSLAPVETPRGWP